MYSFEFDSIIQLKDFQELNSGCFLCVWLEVISPTGEKLFVGFEI